MRIPKKPLTFFKSTPGLILTLFFLIFTANSFYLFVPNSVSNSNFLPILHFAKYQASFQNDLMYQTTQYLFSFYYLIPSLLAPFIEPGFIAYPLLALQNLLIFLSLYFLSLELFEDELAALLTVVLVIIYGVVRYSLGTDVVFGSNLFPDLFAVPLLLFAIKMFLSDRYLLAGFLGGVIFNFHGSQAIFVMFMFMTYYLFNIRQLGGKTVVKSLGLFVMGALPLLVVMSLNPSPDAGHLPFDEWLRHIYSRRGHHSFPSMFVFKRWCYFILAMLPVVVAVLYHPSKDKEKQRKVLFLALGVLLLFIIGTVFTEIFPQRAIINLTMFRSSRFLIILGMIYLSAYLLRVLRQGDQTAALLVFTILYALFNPKLFFLVVPVSLTLIVGELVKKHNWPTFTGQNWLVLLMTLAATEGAFYSIIGVFPQLKALQKIKPLDIYLLSTGAIVVLVSDLIKSRWALAQKVQWGLILLLLTGTVSYQLFPPPQKRVDKQWLAVQKWVNQNAPPDKTVITPPYLRGFRSFGGRGIILSYYDTDDMAYVPHLGQEIMRRLKDLGFSYQGMRKVSWYSSLKVLKRSYESFDEEYFRYLAGKYNSEYLVTLKNHQLAFPKLYQNDLFAVLKVQ